jgi:hypothetical protein
MTTPTTRSRPVPARTLKSPLAAPGKTVQADVVTAASDLAASVQSPLSDRESTLAEFEGYLRTVNNRDGRLSVKSGQAHITPRNPEVGRDRLPQANPARTAHESELGVLCAAHDQSAQRLTRTESAGRLARSAWSWLPVCGHSWWLGSARMRLEVEQVSRVE